MCVVTAAANDALAQRQQRGAVLLVDIKGAIGFVAVGQLAKALEQATAQEAPGR